MTKKWSFISGVAGLALVAAACDGTFPNLGGNTGEVAQFMPDDVTLDVSELPEGDSSAKSANSDLPSGDHQKRGHALDTTGASVHGFHRAVRRALLLGAQIKDDMTSPDNVHVAGEFRLHGEGGKVAYLADFSAFDFDGDGAADGSGNSVDEPVALRLWVDRGEGYERFVAALITVKPTEENLGSGAAYVKPAVPHKDESADLQIYVAWDRTDAAHKWNEAFITGNLGGHFKFENSHHRVDHRSYEDEHVEKTVRSSANFAENPFDFETFQSSAHFSFGSKAALFSVEATGENATISFTDICVNFETKEVDDAACAEFDTSDVAFIDLPTGDETEFPADFPEEPTFTPEEADNPGGETDSDNGDNDNNNDGE